MDLCALESNKNYIINFLIVRIHLWSKNEFKLSKLIQTELKDSVETKIKLNSSLLEANVGIYKKLLNVIKNLDESNQISEIKSEETVSNFSLNSTNMFSSVVCLSGQSDEEENEVGKTEENFICWKNIWKQRFVIS